MTARKRVYKKETFNYRQSTTKFNINEHVHVHMTVKDSIGSFMLFNQKTKITFYYFRMFREVEGAD